MKWLKKIFKKHKHQWRGDDFYSNPICVSCGTLKHSEMEKN